MAEENAKSNSATSEPQDSATSNSNKTNSIVKPVKADKSRKTSFLKRKTPTWIESIVGICSLVLLCYWLISCSTKGVLSPWWASLLAAVLIAVSFYTLWGSTYEADDSKKSGKFSGAAALLVGFFGLFIIHPPPTISNAPKRTFWRAVGVTPKEWELVQISATNELSEIPLRYSKACSGPGCPSDGIYIDFKTPSQKCKLLFARDKTSSEQEYIKHSFSYESEDENDHEFNWKTPTSEEKK